MNLVFHISEDGSEIEVKYCASSKTSVMSSRKYFVHLNWIRLATNPNWFDSSIGRARCEFKSRSRQRIFRCRLQCQINMNLVGVRLLKDTNTALRSRLCKPQLNIDH